MSIRQTLGALRPPWSALLALAASAAAAQTAPAPAPATATAAPRPVATAASTAAPRGATALGCLIVPSAVVEVGSAVVGVLESVLVERGATVAKGQLLARLDASVERAAVALAAARANNQADIDSAQSQQLFAEKRAKRTAELTDLRFVSIQAREQADTEASMASMKLAQSLEQRKLAAQELRLARAQLAQRTMTSPFDGVVVERYLGVGERVENRPVLKLAQIDPLRVEVVLSASQFMRVQAGSSARVTPELPGAAPVQATVSVVDRVIDAASNTFRARLSLPNPGLVLPSGVRCKVEFPA